MIDAQVHVVDLDCAGLWIERAMQERKRGGFAGASRTDQRDGLAGQGRETDVDHRRPLAVIGEGNALELDEAAQMAGIDRVRPVAHGRVGVKHVEELLQPRRFGQQPVEHAHDPFQPGDHQAGRTT